MLTETIGALGAVHQTALLAVLLSVPLIYMLTAYGYLVWWHQRPWLLNTVIHENGRLTFLGSLFYFDHFLACVPMVIVFALCAAGGVALTARVPSDIDVARAVFAATLLLGAAVGLVAVTFVASILTVGWRRTIDYALQRIERDGVMSKGGNWNQLQLSNIPIALGTIGIASTLQGATSGRIADGGSLLAGGVACIVAAAAVLVGMSMATRCKWQAFCNPRWLAHSMREVATFPLTGIPIALASVVLVEHALSGARTWSVQPSVPSLLLLGLGALIVIYEFAHVRNVDILAIAQKPSFAAERMSIVYLLAAHAFEHMLDFVFIALLAGGVYALLRCLALT